MQLLYIEPAMLEADPDGVRESPGDIDGLAATIAEQGLLQPLGVIGIGRGRYRVVYGNRRREAALKLGLEKVPCILLDENDPQVFLQQLTENVQRQDLNDYEKARAFGRLRDHLAAHGTKLEGDLDEATGKAVGLTGRTVRRYLGLLDLPEEIHDLLRTGELNVTQAQHLRRIPNRRTQIELARAAINEGMSAAELSRLSAYFASNPTMSIDAALEALQSGLAPALDMSRPAQGGPLAKGGATTLAVDTDDDVWDEDDSANDDGDRGYLSVDDDTVENQPKNKARVFRIRSLDQMVDETDRLSRAHAEGDLTRWVQKDDGAPMKVRLMIKQLNSLLRALRDTASKQGWDVEE